MNIIQTDVNGKTYNIVRASAVNQKELLTLVGGLITTASAPTGSEIDAQFLSGALLRVPSDMLLKIENILLNQVVLNNTDQLITIDDFQDRSFDYFLLIAGALKANLQDFFTYLDESNAPRRRQLELIRAQQDAQSVK
ncbi:MAG: hypothetical protein KAR42_11065 [candidate division Zixibacteria bacterium]|nr:hypothetical protein [candidate division Zixibacteria bacterium]